MNQAQVVTAQAPSRWLSRRAIVNLIATILALAGPTLAQTPLEILSPPKNGLLEIRFPDLTGVESGVREHLLELQTALTTLAKNSAIPDSQLSEAYGALAQCYQAYSLTAPAETCYQNAHRLSPKDFRWAYLLGSVYQQTSKADDALKFFAMARQLSPDYQAAWVNAGNLLVQQNRADEAAAMFTQALKLNPKSAAGHFGLGQVALAKKDYSAAVAGFERALALAPEATRINYSLAMAYRGLGNLDKAQQFLERQGSVGIRVADPLVDGLQELLRGERVHLARGKRAFDARRYADAANAFKQAVAANPDSVPARINLGSALAELGTPYEAIEQFQAALKLDSNNSAAHYNLGVLLAGQKHHEQAIVHLQFVLKQNPQDTEARFKLANQFFQQRRFDEASRELAVVVESDPNNETAVLELAKLQQRNKQFKEALETLERGHKLFPTKGQTIALLAYLLATTPQLELRDGKRAADLAKMVFQAIGSAAHGAIVALALAESGRCDEAADWQRKMIALAEIERNSDLADKLKAELPNYEKVKACRPVSDSVRNQER